MSLSISIGLAQINPTVGAFQHNIALIVNAATLAHQQGVEILVFPELALTSYQPEDLMYRPQFLQEHQAALQSVLTQVSGLQGLHILLGHLDEVEGQLYNAASLILNGN